MKKLTAISMLVIFMVLQMCGCQNCRGGKAEDTRFLMDTVCSIKIGGEKNILSEAMAAAFDEAYEIAAATDYYSETSDVSKINNAEANVPVSVGAHTAAILSAALDVCEKSKGAFDITVAPVKDIWGFNQGDHQPPQAEEAEAVLEYVDYTAVVLNESNCTVTKLSDNIKIDLGGCAKGYAAECVLEVLKEFDVEYALIDFGGNIVTYGHNPMRKDGKWTVGIQKPFARSGEYAETVTVESSAVVTSGVYQRYFKWNNKMYHHIIDPKTGFPTDNGLASVSIICDSALAADCLSTACVVLGEEEGKRLAEMYKAEAVFLPYE